MRIKWEVPQLNYLDQEQYKNTINTFSMVIINHSKINVAMLKEPSQWF